MSSSSPKPPSWSPRPRPAEHAERTRRHPGEGALPRFYRGLVDVTLLYFDGCPNSQETEQRLRLALRALGRDEQQLTRPKVNSPAEAGQLSFRGSPSVPSTARSRQRRGPLPGPGCTGRALLPAVPYPHRAGRSPTIDQLLQALRR